MRYAVASLLAALALAACGPAGTPPTISALGINPSTISVGQSSSVLATFSYRDTDGDIDHIAGRITLPDGRTTDLSAPVTGDVHAESGQLSLRVTAVAPVAGRYRLDVWLVDSSGQESNRLHGDVEATEN